MTRAAFALLGVVILGISAGAVYRELTSPDKSADGASAPEIAATSGGLEAGRTAVSRALPDLRFVDGAGAPRSLADFRGRVILLNLWATWCVPCRKEMPALDRLQAALGRPGFEVVALSLDQGGVAAVKSFYEELDLRALRIYVDQNGDALRKLGNVGIPLTVLVDRDGRELWRVIGPREWDQPAEANRIRSHLAQSSTH
jgi:thiol-disulfide isomerase/thioredoxin